MYSVVFYLILMTLLRHMIEDAKIVFNSSFDSFFSSNKTENWTKPNCLELVWFGLILHIIANRLVEEIFKPVGFVWLGFVSKPN